MGSSQSQAGQVISASPPEQKPEELYHGPEAQYQFINVEVKIASKVTIGALNMITSNVEAYYPFLAAQYEQGFRLLTFYHIPGQAQRTGGLFSVGVLMPFQGIFCRYPQAPSFGRFRLHIEKSTIQPQIVWNGFITFHSQTQTDISHLYQTIANCTQSGGRLICLELTGQQEAHYTFSMNARMPAMGVDLFFEMPLDGPQETYMYNIVSIPINVTISPGFRPTPKVQCDWAGVMSQNLGMGFRLVEIFMDGTQSTQSAGLTGHIQTNSQWFFEKPASRVNDPTPVYQGKVVEHFIKISASGLSGVKTTTNWEPVIQENGRAGWELACILETQEQVIKGLATVYMKVILFFQRKILH